VNAFAEALDELRARYSAYNDPHLDRTDTRFALITGVRDLLAAADERTVPEGKVLVDVEDVRALTGWRDRRLLPARYRDALDRLVAALPAPEWEPSEDEVDAWFSIIFPDALKDEFGYRGAVVRKLKRAHAAGLLSPEVTR